jgi:hypothetical protein
MSNEVLDPWETASEVAPAAPIVQNQQELDPWEQAAGPMNPSQTSASNFPEPQVSDNPPAGSEIPIEQKMAENAVTAGSGMQATLGAGTLATKAMDLFKHVPDLLDAGIRPSTLKRMVPQGINPDDFAKTLQNSLNQDNAIGSNPAETWTQMFNNTNKAGKSVAAARDAIAQAAGPQALNVNAQTALEPIYNAWKNEVDAIVPDNKTISTFGKYYEGLSNIAQNQGGNLTLDNIHQFLQEIGPRTHAGTDAMQDIYSKLYSVGMNAQDGMVNTIANQANNPALAQNLKDANSAYSTYMRLMPDVTANTTKEALKEGMSAFQKYGGPTILKTAFGTGTGLTGSELLKKLYEIVSGTGE